MPAWMQSIGVISPIRWAILAIEGGVWRASRSARWLLPCAILIVVGVVVLRGRHARSERGLVNRPRDHEEYHEDTKNCFRMILDLRVFVLRGCLCLYSPDAQVAVRVSSAGRWASPRSAAQTEAGHDVRGSLQASVRRRRAALARRHARRVFGHPQRAAGTARTATRGSATCHRRSTKLERRLRPALVARRPVGRLSSAASRKATG